MRAERALRAGLFLLAWLWLIEAVPAPLPGARPAQPTGEGVEHLLWGGRLDPNRAPEAALQVLPRIGRKRAAAILADRPFCTAAEIRRVRGIGPVTWAGIRDSLEVRERPKECKAEAARTRDGG